MHCRTYVIIRIPVVIQPSKTLRPDAALDLSGVGALRRHLAVALRRHLAVALRRHLAVALRRHLAEALRRHIDGALRGRLAQVRPFKSQTALVPRRSDNVTTHRLPDRRCAAARPEARRRPRPDGVVL